MRNVIFGGWVFIKRFRILLAVVLILSSILGFIATAHFKPSDKALAKTQLISQNRPVIASSVESALFPPENAIDGNPKTSWSSAWSDPQWIAIDFGTSTKFNQVELDWTASYALVYQLQVSDDGLHWQTIYTQNDGKGNTETINVSAQGRYLRMYGIKRATIYGYSLWSFNVYERENKAGTPVAGTTNPTPTPKSAPMIGGLPGLPSLITPTPVPTAKPTAIIDNGNGSASGNEASPSGQAMPVGDLPGWHQIFAENFNTNASLGSFPGAAYGNEFTTYPDGTPDTAGQQGAPSRYEPSKVVSVSNGLLNLYLHTQNGTPMAAAILPTLPGNDLYGKYTVRFRSDELPGFKVAWLLWPDSEVWPGDGEIDFPESDLSGTINAFMHRQGATSGSDQDAYSTSATYSSWHTASIEWTPNAVNFILDGQLIGQSTNRIPNTPMHWVLQTESSLTSCPAASTAGNLQIDWVTAYSLS